MFTVNVENGGIVQCKATRSVVVIVAKSGLQIEVALSIYFSWIVLTFPAGYIKTCPVLQC